MKTNFRTLAAFCSLAFAINTGCADSAGESVESTVPLVNSGSVTHTTIANDESQQEISEDIPSAEDSCEITFSSSGCKVSGSGAKASDGIATISSAGVYRVSGKASGAGIIVDADKDAQVYIILAGADLTSDEGSVIYCKKAAKLVLTLEEGTESRLSDSENYVFEDGDDEPDAAVFAKCAIVVNGEGSLNVNGAYSDGIKSKEGFKLCGGSVTVTASGDGVKGRDYVKLLGGALSVTSGDDGIKTTNADDGDAAVGKIYVKDAAVNVTAGKDGIQSETQLVIDSGEFKLVTGGGSADAVYKTESFGRPFERDSSDDENTQSMKGLKAGTLITINGGSFDIDSMDDAVHSNGTVTVSKGDFVISTGDDGFHADENLTIADGNISIKKSYEGLEGKSVDISGGIIELNAYDDGINAAGGDNGMFFGFGEASDEYYISISGGTITVNADGDGLDSNGTIAMSGGTVVVNGPTDSMNGALDFDKSFAVSGGTLVALGSVGMAQTPTTLSQPCLAINYTVSAGSSIEIRDSEGNGVIALDALKKCESLIFSTESFKTGEKYSLYVDGKEVYTVTAEDGVSGNGANSGGFGHGFNGGGFGDNFNPADFNSDGFNPEDFDGEMPEMPNMPDFDGDFDPSNKPEKPADDGGRGRNPSRDIPEGFTFDGATDGAA